MASKGKWPKLQWYCRAFLLRRRRPRGCAVDQFAGPADRSDQRRRHVM